MSDFGLRSTVVLQPKPDAGRSARVRVSAAPVGGAGMPGWAFPHSRAWLQHVQEQVRNRDRDEPHDTAVAHGAHECAGHRTARRSHQAAGVLPASAPHTAGTTPVPMTATASSAHCTPSADLPTARGPPRPRRPARADKQRSAAWRQVGVLGLRGHDNQVRGDASGTAVSERAAAAGCTSSRRASIRYDDPCHERQQHAEHRADDGHGPAHRRRPCA